MKCSVCKNKIETIFLNKILGSHVKDAKGKRHPVCSKCQSEHTTDEIRTKL
jgi:hypothetical protein